MRKNLGANNYLYPMPVFILASYDKNNLAQAMNVAYGGISNTNEISLCVSPGHKTVEALLDSKTFSVSMGTEKQVIECDYVGIISGNNELDKINKVGWHVLNGAAVDVPLFDELPMGLECTLESYDSNTGRLVGNIKNVSVDESILNERGTIDPSKLDPIVYDHMNRSYHVLGKKVGQAFSDGKKLL